MSGRADPGRTGVVAGRAVGAVTACLATWSLYTTRESFYQGFSVVLSLFGIEWGYGVTVLFWGNVVLAAAGRYAICYVVGSLLGVLYDTLDRPPMAGFAVVVLLVGLVDGALAVADTRNVLVGAGYVLAWLVFVPLFAHLFDPEATDVRTAPTRLGDSK